MKKWSLWFIVWMLFLLASCTKDTTQILKFESNGGSLIEDIEITPESVLVMPNAPEKDGYAFNGWYWDQSTFQEPFSSSSFQERSSDDVLILYAKWQLVTYSITYHLDGGQHPGYQPTEFTIEQSLTITSPTKTGYVFQGWFHEPEFITLVTHIVAGTFGHLHLYAKWTEEIIVPSVYQIEWKLDDGTLLEKDDVDSGMMPTYDGLVPTKPSSLTHTYVFIGWSPSVVPATQDQIYTAVFEAHEITIKAPFDPAQLNAIFGFDIYALMPELFSDDYEIFDYSEGTFKEVYIDVFDWTDALSDDYMDLLDSMLSYDIAEDAWVIGNYYLYVYEDDETYPGQTVYGIGIYGESGSGHENPVDGLFAQFNIQDTTTELTSSYRDQIHKTLNIPGADGKVIVKASYLANITGTPPSGLTQGIIFASDVSSTSSPLVYLEFDASSVIIQSFSLTIEARDAFGSRLKGAKLQIYNGSSWVDLPGGDFYSQISTDPKSITIEGINASRFRLLFTGSGATSNGGQFKITTISLYTGKSESETFELWSDMIVALEQAMKDEQLSDVMKTWTSLTEMSIARISSKEYAILGTLNGLNPENVIASYLADLLLDGFAIHHDLSSARNQNVYAFVVHQDKAYALYILHDETNIEIRIWIFDPVIEQGNLSTLSYRQSINQYEILKFGQSGLPSIGTFDVLVIPVEINGTPFPSDYQSKLNLVFNGTSEATGWESVRTYYQKSSYGLLNLNFVIADKYVTQNNKAQYQSYGDAGDQYVIYETMLAIDPSIDFSVYDYNNDGHLDSVIFIYSVNYDSEIDPWWAWVFAAKFGEADKLSTLDGKHLEYYMWASYAFLSDSIPGLSGLVVNAETYIHEVGHLMGFVDLYSQTHDYGPLGGFDMMDFNVGDHGPFNKLVFGWLKPLVGVTGSYSVTIDAYATDTDGLQSAVIIPYRSTDFDDGNAFDEYLLIVFYTPKGLYQGHLSTEEVPDHAGIVVYHIDARMLSNTSFWGNYFRYDNDGTSGFIAQILEADKNGSIPSNTQSIKMSDFLTSGTFDLSSYTWNQGGSINVSIELLSSLSSESEQATFVLTIS